MIPGQLRIGWNLPGTFTRLGLHVGMILAWIRAGLPLPTLVVATSAGAIIAACCVSFDKKILHRVAGVVGNLRRQQIFTLSVGLKQTRMYLLAAPCMLVLFYVLSRSFHGGVSFLMLIAGLGIFTGLVYWATKVFFRSESPLDTAPLRELLLKEVDFQALFEAKTELRILAADVMTPQACVFSNHEPWKTDYRNQEHRERFVDVILGSSGLPGRFPLRFVDGKCLRDAEVWTDFPIHQFSGQCDLVFRFDYWEPLQPAPAPRHWLGDLFRCFDVMRDKNTRIKMQQYELEREKDPKLPRVIPIRASIELLRRISDLAVYDFKPKQLWRSVRLGYRIIRENLPLIRHELGLNQYNQ